MGILEVNQIKSKLEDEYRDLISLKDLKNSSDDEKVKHFLSRSLAAYSISVLYPDVNKEEVIKCIVDGSDDNGIDIIYYHQDTNELCLVQSKFNRQGNSEPDLGEIQKFVSGVRDLINLKFDKFNEKVNNMKEEIIDSLKKSKLKFKIILAYTATNLSTHARREFSDLLDDLNDHRDVADLEIMNQKRFHASLYNDGKSRNIDINVDLQDWGRYEGEMEAFYGQISADQLADLWETHANNLFEQNLRKVLGTTEINKELQQTLDTEPELFWYFNNGITLVCEEVDKKRVFGNSRAAGSFECKGISIVNGAQTVGVIGKYGQASEENKTRLEEVKIPFRIISISRTDEDGENYLDELFASEVTTKNNRQNSIEKRDFVVLDPFQKKVERDLSLEGITYHLMRSEEEEQMGETSFGLKEATRALAFASDIDSTILVRREISSVYEDLNSPKYRKLFNPGVTSYYIWNCVRIQRYTNKIIEDLSIDVDSDEQKAILIYGKELISRIIFDLITKAKIESYSLEIQEAIDAIDFVEKITLLLQEIQKEVNASQKTIINIFKSPSDIKDLYNKMTKLLDPDREEPVVEENKFDINNMEDLTRLEKLQLQKFYKKIQDDDIAVNFFQKWLIEMYEPKENTLGYRSNLHYYKNQPGKQATEKFLFRIAYYTKLIISFEFKAFGMDYNSVLYQKPEFKEWAEQNTDDKNRIVINTLDDVRKALEVKDYL